MTSVDGLLSVHGHEFTTACAGACDLYRLCRSRHSGMLASVLSATDRAALPAPVATFDRVLGLAAAPDTADGDDEQTRLAADLAAAAADLALARRLP